MTWARPNVFQRLVLCWERLHPYNGAQLAELHRPCPDHAALEAAWADTLAELGLGRVVFRNGPGGEYRFEPVVRPPVVCVDGADTGGWDAVLSDELNRRYDDADVPLRLLVGPAGQGGCRVGIAYRHWVADSVAVRSVLGALLSRVFPGLRVRRACRWAPPKAGYWRLFGPSDFGGGGRWSLLPALLTSATQASRGRRVCRVEGARAALDVTFSSHSLPDTPVSRLVQASRRRGIKLNDLLLACLALAVRRHGPQTPTTRRHDLALGTIVDLRRLSAAPLENVFGLYLGFTTTFLRPGQLRDLDTAARAVARQAELHRRQSAAAASQLRMAFGLLTHRYLDDADVLEWYRKRVPLAAGISNVNLAGDWPAAAHPGLVRSYLRVSPTGPMMPLVISVTTLGEQLHLGLTRRRELVTDAAAACIVGEVLHHLRHVAADPAVPCLPLA
ncbi:MAG: hypothetical protein ACK4PI_11785 [Tepidisphaerales bacterium]